MWSPERAGVSPAICGKVTRSSEGCRAVGRTAGEDARPQRSGHTAFVAILRRAWSTSSRRREWRCVLQDLSGRSVAGTFCHAPAPNALEVLKDALVDLDQDGVIASVIR